MGDILKIAVTANILHISISAEDLAQMVNNNSENNFRVTDPIIFAERFAEQLRIHTTSNSQEVGITALEEFFEEIASETYVNDDGASVEDKDQE